MKKTLETEKHNMTRLLVKCFSRLFRTLCAVASSYGRSVETGLMSQLDSILPSNRHVDHCLVKVRRFGRQIEIHLNREGRLIWQSSIGA